MGVTVREKPKGSGIWYVFVNQAGTRKAKKVGTKKAAMAVKSALEKKIASGTFNLEERKVPAFGQLATVWVETVVAGISKETTYNRYRQLLNDYVLPELGTRTVTEISRGMVKQVLLDLKGRGFSRSSVETVKNVISGVFNHAIDLELIRHNPCQRILKDLRMAKPKHVDINPYNDEEKDVFLWVCETRYPDLYPFFLTAFQTGLRLGELIALEWGMIDFFKKRLRVNQSLRNNRLTDPKTAGSKRWVDMTDGVVKELRKLQLAHKKATLAGKSSPVVFSVNGQFMTQNYARRAFERVFTKAGLRRIRFHDIRHTYASLMISKGANMKYVAEQMGHASIDITVNVYSRFVPQGTRSEVNLLEDNRLQPSATYTQPSAGKVQKMGDGGDAGI